MITTMLSALWTQFQAAREDEGQGLAEYGLILALVAVLLVGALIALKGDIADVFNSVDSAFDTTT